MTEFAESDQRDPTRDLPRITVVTPSYNQAEFLGRTIQSVISQDYPNLEYMVIDGGSTDGSVDVIKRYEDRLDYWVSEPDRGQSHAINKGFKRSTGEILAWLNSDDTYEPGALMEVGRYFREHPEVEVVYGDANLIDVQDTVVERIIGQPFNARALIYGCINLHQASAFWRRELFYRAGRLDEELHLGMDYDLWFRFVRLGARFKYLPVMLANFRQHPGSKTVREDSALEARAAKEKHLGIRRDSFSYRFWHRFYRARKAWFYLIRGDFSHLMLRVKEAAGRVRKRAL